MDGPTTKHEKAGKFLADNAQKALTVARIWFYDGGVNTFYSFDTPAAHKNHDIWPGFNGLKTRLIETKFKGAFKTAEIYENKPGNTGKRLAQWIDGVRTI